MNTYLISWKYTFIESNVIQAESEEQAKEILYDMSDSELIPEADDSDLTVKDVELDE